MTKIVQNSFFGGQLDYEMMGRQDFGRYAKGASRLLNFNILKRGGLDKRHGFDRLVDIKNADLGITPTSNVRLVPFAYTKNIGFVLMFVGGHIRVLCVKTGTVAGGSDMYEMYAVDGSDNVYSSNEIGEIDYQQCGDVMFIAHRNHPPAKITHYITGNQHGFKFEKCSFNSSGSGIPSITDATCTRAPVKCTGATKTEYYVATSVFKDGETLPCEVFSGSGVGQNTGKENTGSWGGTSYYMPWTESQKITLRIKPVSRTARSGEVEAPDKVRIYKKAFNYFGLIGSVDASGGYSNVQTGTLSGHPAPAHDTNLSDGSEPVSVYTSFNGKGPYGSVGYSLVIKAKDISRSLRWYFKLGSSSKNGDIKIMFGSAIYKFNNATNPTVVTFKYYPSMANELTIGGGAFESEKTISLTPGTPIEDVVVTRGDDESAESFEYRWRDEFNVFMSEIKDQEYVTVKVTSTGTDVWFYTTGGDLVVCGIGARKYTSPSAVTFDDVNIIPDSSITPPEKLDKKLFVGDGNYPSTVSMTQQRLVWASTNNDPARIWMSQVGDFYTYDTHEIQRPDDAIDFIVPITRFNSINHIVEMRKLLMFNTACEWMVDSASSTQGITYETIQAYPQSYSGSNQRLKPIVCNNAVVFCERSGQSVRRFAWDLSADGFAGRDMSTLSCSIFEQNPIVDWTYQQFPFSTLWCVLADGTLASFEYMEEHDIMAWATHSLGCDDGSNFAEVVSVSTSCALAPNLDEVMITGAGAKYDSASHEEVFAVVRRGHYGDDGAKVYDSIWIERMRPRPRRGNGGKMTDTVYHSLCLDSVRVLNKKNKAIPMDYSSASETWLDASVNNGLVYIPSDTTDGRPITREQALSRLLDPDDDVTIYEGYPFKAEFQSVYPVVTTRTVGAGQMDIKDIGNVGLRLMSSCGGTVRATGCDETEPIRYEDDPAEIKTPVFGGGLATFKDLDAANVKPVGINTRDGRFHVEQSEPWPFTILMYEVDVELEIPTGR